MNSTQHIIVGVDGSPGGERALRWAVREASHHPATIEAITAFMFDAMDGSILRYRRAQRDAAQQMLATQVNAVLAGYPGVTVTTRLAYGSASEVLVDAAAKADLLVIGSHGHGRLFHALLGSIAEDCVRRATCAVVVVPAPLTVKAAEPVGAASAGKTASPAPVDLPTVIL